MRARLQALWDEHADVILLAPAAFMLPVTVWRLLIAIDTRQSLCGDQDREHMAALLTQAGCALAIAGLLFMLRPSVVQGDERYRFGAVTLLTAAVVVFIGIFTKDDLLAFSGCS